MSAIDSAAVLSAVAELLDAEQEAADSQDKISAHIQAGLPWVGDILPGLSRVAKAKIALAEAMGRKYPFPTPYFATNVAGCVPAFPHQTLAKWAGF